MRGFFHLPTQEVLEYPLEYVSLLRIQKLYQVHLAVVQKAVT